MLSEVNRGNSLNSPHTIHSARYLDFKHYLLEDADSDVRGM